MYNSRVNCSIDSSKSSLSIGISLAFAIVVPGSKMALYQPGVKSSAVTINYLSGIVI